MDFHLRQAACVDVRGKITTKVCRNRERYQVAKETKQRKLTKRDSAAIVLVFKAGAFRY